MITESEIKVGDVLWTFCDKDSFPLKIALAPYEVTVKSLVPKPLSKEIRGIHTTEGGYLELEDLYRTEQEAATERAMPATKR